MFGWRKRIGYIGPTVMEVVPYEFYKFAPEGIGLVGVTCNIDDWSAEWFDKALAQVAEAGRYLGSRGVDFVLHGGGPLVVARGEGFDEIIVRDIERASGVPASTGVRAAMEALRHLGARRIAIASPYPERHNRAMADYLAKHGFDDRRRRRHGCAVQTAASGDACRHQNIRRRCAAPCQRLRRTLPALPAMAGIADRRCHGARHRHPDRRLHACEFFRRLQGARHN